MCEFPATNSPARVPLPAPPASHYLNPLHSHACANRVGNPNGITSLQKKVGVGLCFLIPNPERWPRAAAYFRRHFSRDLQRSSSLHRRRCGATKYLMAADFETPGLAVAEALVLRHGAFHLFAGGVGGRADALDAQLEVVGIRGADQ